MNMQMDSSELQEAADIFNELIAQSAVVAPAFTSHKRPKITQDVSIKPIRTPVKETSFYGSGGIETTQSKVIYRGDRLESSLLAMCKRGGFSGAVVADIDGLPLAVYNSPVSDDAVAAFTSVLGDALEKAGKLLEQHDANYISMDINYTEKVVLRRFIINELSYFLMVICPQEVDERDEVELSIDQIASILR